MNSRFGQSKEAENERPGKGVGSVRPDEAAKFAAWADQWWEPSGSFAPLHKFNPARLEVITEHLRGHFQRSARAVAPFAGLKFLDIGCGGGLVCEPMARLGASVTGVDAVERNVGAARDHAKRSGLDIDYRVGTAEGMLPENAGAFDVVLNLEVVEHVADPSAFLGDCARLLAPGGCMAVATINRTARAFLTAIVGAEYVLRWLPRGTHEFARLVKPSEAITALEEAGLEVEPPIGMTYNPLRDHWSAGTGAGVNYMLFAAAPDGEQPSSPGDAGHG